MATLVLASSSPRRRELLSLLRVPFEIRAPEVDERMRRGESPVRYVRRLAVLKASVATLGTPGSVVIGADTTVVIDGRVIGKPRSESHAMRMLATLEGRTHQVLTGVAVVDSREARPRTRTFVARTSVRFAPMSRAEIRAYVESGEPLDKAGAYAIQGHGAAFVAGVRGSVTNVIGLPLAELRRLLVGLDVLPRAPGATFRARGAR